MRKFIAVSWLTLLVVFSATAKSTPVLHFSASEKFIQSQSVSIGSVSVRNSNSGDQQAAFQLNAASLKVNAYRHFHSILSSTGTADIQSRHFIKEMSLQHSETRYGFIQQILFPKHHFW